mmetsp:Transcript_33718/g.132626  ORF Transcript_33718/g.132626 Transcript_33718/m.132626 type:complete len:90 (+) Transcript_33718:81-350(+)
MTGFISSTVYAFDRSTTKCAACSRREAMRAVGMAVWGTVLANIGDAPVLAVEEQAKGLEYYGIALDIRQSKFPNATGFFRFVSALESGN